MRHPGASSDATHAHRGDPDSFHFFHGAVDARTIELAVVVRLRRIGCHEDAVYSQSDH